MDVKTRQLAIWVTLFLGLVGVGWQAWLVAHQWFIRQDLVSPLWFVYRASLVVFIFYPSVALVRFLERRRLSWVGLSCVGAWVLSTSTQIYRTIWELPIFVGIHLVVLAGWLIHSAIALWRASPELPKAVGGPQISDRQAS